ncbi:Creatinase/aminopeptidase [Punctularia strigosozonata HHB-11173 SS5]|uniref:Creatinase/aminopeptidase n=1 Tax=Punctularia strigosozonata (strain HHB-11173) TaxID=741275 RepID=UPI00044164A0|nr:Creatinase/aminopeptidase [Punctularia strigosozonata HHB-11173 SS5]EIN12435.1 Creatinase/aminopeptidase [Punctularia strigosozonata HHB-11173 SS5]
MVGPAVDEGKALDDEAFFVVKLGPSKIRASKLGVLFLAFCAALYLWGSSSFIRRTTPTVPATSPESYAHLASHCASIPPISANEFHARQTALAQTLASLNASAYIAEPGANAQFFGNISGSSWHLSERPLLLIVSPAFDAFGEVQPKITILTPYFEETRAKLLEVPAADGVEYAAWPEEADPYAIAVSAIGGGSGKIFVDASIRHFIVDGLRGAVPESVAVESAPLEIRYLRERKSPAELEILKCVNEVTVLAVREVRDKMYIGIRESEARDMILAALGAAGLHDLDSLVLFGENAALPHGSGTDRVLGKNDFALFDCGGGLHSYFSDVTRTFALKDTVLSKEQLALWKLVHAAQTKASTFKNGTITREVDEAARAVIEDGGYGRYFTHRLGHGIGLEVHEQPYLRGGSSDVIQIGHTFTNEPGIYIEGKVGIRLEDCFYVDENGDFTFLTAGVGGQATCPWSP